VHFERLVIESGSTTFALDFHPRLTIIAGVGRLERDGLVNELLASLGSGRDGVHLELASDAGARYTIFRPVNGRHRVVDIDQEQDVTSAFLGEQGDVDLLERTGLSERSAKRQLRITAADLATDSTQEEYILTLAHVDQGRLWDVATKVKDREDQLNEAAAAEGSSVEDADLIEEIERRHREFEDALARHERVRHLWFMLGGITAIGTVPAALLLGNAAALPLMLAAIATTVASIVCWRRLEDARASEQEALREVGAHSYLNFHITRVNGLVASDQQRRRLLAAAEYHRAALVEWQLLAGDVPVDWALEHQREVRQAATKLRTTIGGMSNPMALTMSEVEETTADVAHTLLRKLEAMRDLTSGVETLPVFLDDAFSHLDPAAKPQLLEVLVSASHRQQIIYLTEDADVADWARVEAMTGELAVVEPGSRRPSPSGPDGVPKRTKRSRHVAA